MKLFALTALACCFCALSLEAQVHYKQNFLLAFSKQPELKDCEAAYSFLGNTERCAAFYAANASLAKAYEELAALQLAASSAAMPSSSPTMNAEDGKSLAEKLKKMTKEEKKQWAMQNAKNFMPSAAMRVNKDIDNQPVNEAVRCVTDQQAKDLRNKFFWMDFSAQFTSIDKKYAPKKEGALKKFQSVSGTDYNPSSSGPYVFGETSDAQIAGFHNAVAEYKKAVLPVYNSEMKEKITCILQAEKELVKTYTLVEEKIASTQYAEDAQEPSNRLHLIVAHINVLNKVNTTIDTFGSILSDYADQYAALMKIEPVKKISKKGNR